MTPEGIQIRKLKKAEYEDRRRKHVVKELDLQMSREGKQGNWHKITRNRDFIHLSQLKDYDMWQDEDL